MKLIYLTIATAILSQAASAAVLTVNNNNPTPGQYSSLAAAQTAATAGDTLYISGSPYNYNGFTFSKRLTLIGTGHKPQNADPSVSVLDDIDFAGAAASINGSKIIGLDLNQVTFNVSGMSNVEISRCKFRYRLNIVTPTSFMTIEGNYFENQALVNIATDFYSSISDYIIRNNVFNYQIGPFYGYYGIGNIYIRNNLFLNNGNAFSGEVRYATIINNIFYRASPTSGGTIANTIFSNNIEYQTTTSYQTSSNTLTGNLNTNPLFVNFPTLGDYYSYNYDFSLQPTSPALNAGNDGRDIGLTGGDGYFQKYGIPAIPQIRSFSITSPLGGTVSPGGTLQVQLISTIKR